MVASAVAGLDPSDVSVIDGDNGRVLGQDGEGNSPTEQATSDKLRERVQRLLEARVGLGNAIVEVSVEKVMDRESIVERRFDPDTRVAISKETEERTTDSTDSGGGNVTVASNLPEGDGAEGRNSTSQNSETRERINFEVSETQREIQRAPGAIKRLSVAVLVDGVRSTDDAGVVNWEPRSEVELEALRDLVASAVGLDEARGDVITLRTLEFNSAEALGTQATPPDSSSFDLDLMSLIQLGVLAVVTLLLGLFVVRPILGAQPKSLLPVPSLPGGEVATASGLQMHNQILADGEPSATVLNTLAAPSNEMVAASMQGVETDGGETLLGTLEVDENGLSDATLEFGTKDDHEDISDPVERLRKLIEERREETVEILREWVESPKADA